MPDIITHYLFGLDSSKNIKTSPLYKIIKENKSLFFIGLQGPDPMYYQGLHKKNNYSYIAKLIHNEKPAEFLIACLTHAKKNSDTPDLFNPCMSYISGLICHYVLDYMAHPYIFYLGGYFIPNKEETFKYNGLHKKIELAIDSLLLEDKFGIKANTFKIHKHILKDVTLPKSILDLYEDTLFSVYGIPNGGKIFKKSYLDFRNYYKLTYDRLGSKKLMVTSFAPLLPRKISAFSESFSYYNCHSSYIDYLNLSKKVWLHPITGNVYTFSFKDILHNALKISVSLLLKSYDFIESTISYEELTAVFPDYSYVTGLSPSDLRPMKYFSPDYIKL